MQLLQRESLSKPEKAAPVTGPLDATAASSSTLNDKSVPKSARLPVPTSRPPQAAPAEVEKGFKEPLVEGTGVKEEYGYIVTNQRSAFVLIATYICNHFFHLEKNN